MKLTRKQLKEIIRTSVRNNLKENFYEHGALTLADLSSEELTFVRQWLHGDGDVNLTDDLLYKLTDMYSDEMPIEVQSGDGYAPDPARPTRAGTPEEWLFDKLSDILPEAKLGQTTPHKQISDEDYQIRITKERQRREDKLKRQFDPSMSRYDGFGEGTVVEIVEQIVSETMAEVSGMGESSELKRLQDEAMEKVTAAFAEHGGVSNENVKHIMAVLDIVLDSTKESYDMGNDAGYDRAERDLGADHELEDRLSHENEHSAESQSEREITRSRDDWNEHEARKSSR